MHRLVSFVSLVSLVLGCGRATPAPAASSSSAPPAAAAPSGGTADYVADVQTLCDGPTLAAKHLPGLDPSQKARMIMATLDDRGWPKTDHMRVFFRTIAGESVVPKEKSARLRAEATRVGIGACAMADFFEVPR